MNSMIPRRHLLLAAAGIPGLPLLSGCRTTLRAMSATATTPDAHELLMTSAAAHGDASFRTLHDVNVAYSGKWHGLVARLQPALVDSAFRGGSEERILLRDGWLGQTHVGPRGRKQVVRHFTAIEKGSVRVWFNSDESRQEETLDAAALVADAYSLFLFGPMLLSRYAREGRKLVMQRRGSELLEDGKRRYSCDVLRISMQPGVGLSNADQLELFIDRDTLLMRRLRFSLDGLASTQGALVEVDTLDPVTLHSVQWPTRFHEKLLRPLPLQVHDWRLTGLDIDRGLDPASVSGSAFTGSAVPPARALPT